MRRTTGLWLLIAAVSPAAEIAFYAGTGAVPRWLVWARLAIMAAALVPGLFGRAAVPYRSFCATYGSLLFAGILVRYIASRAGPPAVPELKFEQRMIVTGLERFAIALVVLLVASRLSGRSLDAMYIRMGDLRAKLRPAWFRIAGFPVRWRLAGPVVAVFSAVCVRLFLASAGQLPPFESGLLPWAVVFAASNAFVEEAIYRSALIASVQTEFGSLQAVAASAVVFGLTHWNGIPFGVAGVLMTLAFGLVAGKAMVETRGMFWPWFMHMLPDLVIYYYWGAGAVRHP